MHWITRALAMAFLLGAPSAMARQGYPKVYNIYLSHKVRPDQWETLAKWDVLVLDADFEYSNPGGLATLRALNPEIILLGFMPINGMLAAGNQLPPSTVNYRKWNGINEADFWLYDTQGQIVSDWPRKWSTNLTPNSPKNSQGEAYWAWFARFVYEEMWLGGPGWDGIFLDDVWEDVQWLNNFLASPIDSDRDSQPDSGDRLDAWWHQTSEACVDSLRSLLGPDAILVNNGHNTYHQALNGAMLEDFPMFGRPEQDNVFGYAWSKWMFSTLGSYTMGDHYRSTPRQLMMINAGWAQGTVDSPDTTTGRFKAHKRFVLGSTLLRDGYFSMDRTYTHNTMWWQPEYDRYLGAPLGPQTIEVVDGLTVYVRHYEAVSVAVNPNNQPVHGVYGFPDVEPWDAYIGDPFTFSPPPDTTPPAAVTLYSGFPVDEQSLEVRWQAVGDDGMIGFADHYEIRYSQSDLNTESAWQAGTVVPQNLAPLGAGTIQAVQATGLRPETRYYVSVRAVDEAGNRGGLPSQPPYFTTFPRAAPDTIPPDAVANLSLAGVDGLNLSFQWDAPGDDGSRGTAESYQARWSRGPLDEANWNSADLILGLPIPSAANTKQSASLAGVNAETPVFIALRARDEAGNWSDLSNVLVVQEDIFPALPVTDLTLIDSLATALVLRFTAPENPGGRIAGYVFRYREGVVFPKSDWEQGAAVPLMAPASSGQTVLVTIDGLSLNTPYAVRMRTVDGRSRLSDPSNLVLGATAPPPPPAPRDTVPPDPIATLSATLDNTGSVSLTWIAVGDHGTGQAILAYDLRWRENGLDATTWPQAGAIPTPRPGAPGSLESIQAALWEPPSTGVLTLAFALTALDSSGNVSGLSNVASVEIVAPALPPDTQPPSVPVNLTAEAMEDGIHLRWDPVPDADLDHYRLYRGSQPRTVYRDLLRETTFLDAWVDVGVEYSYTVASVDGAGNESALSPDVLARVPNPSDAWLASHFTAGPPSPNPAGEQLKVTVQLGRETSVRIDVLDVQGRRVYSTMVSMPKGEQDWYWDRRDGSGARSPSGVYWLRLQANQHVITRKVLLLP